MDFPFLSVVSSRSPPRLSWGNFWLWWAKLGTSCPKVISSFGFWQSHSMGGPQARFRRKKKETIILWRQLQMSSSPQLPVQPLERIHVSALDWDTWSSENFLSFVIISENHQNNFSTADGENGWWLCYCLSQKWLSKPIISFFPFKSFMSGTHRGASHSCLNATRGQSIVQMSSFPCFSSLKVHRSQTS